MEKQVQKNSNTIEVDLMKLLKALWRRIWAIVLATVIFGSSAFLYASFAVTPMYKATALMYVNNSAISVGSTSFSITPGELSAAKHLVDIYVVILKTRNTLDEVIEKAGLDYSYEKLRTMIEAGPVNSTEIFSIEVTSPSPYEAELIANTITEVLPEQIADIVDGASVRIVDRAVVPSRKASPNITKYTAMGMLVGAVLSCVCVIFIVMFDATIRSADDLTENQTLPVLAVIPDLSLSKANEGYYYKKTPQANNGKEVRSR